MCLYRNKKHSDRSLVEFALYSADSKLTMGSCDAHHIRSADIINDRNKPCRGAYIIFSRLARFVDFLTTDNV